MRTLILLGLLAGTLAAGDTKERRPEIFCKYASKDSQIDKDRIRIRVDGWDPGSVLNANWELRVDQYEVTARQ